MSTEGLTPDEAKRLQELKAALREPVLTLYRAQDVAGNDIREKTKAAFGRLIDAHLLINGVIAVVLLRTNGKLTPDGVLNPERRVLFASYVVGIPLCEIAIQEGRYLQALTLIRQEMETVAQIIRSYYGVQKRGKQPSVSVLPKDIARTYDDLSAAAHLAKPDMTAAFLSKVSEGIDRTSRVVYFHPVENLRMARQAFALHLTLTLHLINVVATDYNRAHPEDGFGPTEHEALTLASRLMELEGVVEGEKSEYPSPKRPASKSQERVVDGGD